jgi:hypothetical protein
VKIVPSAPLVTPDGMLIDMRRSKLDPAPQIDVTKPVDPTKSQP